MLLFDYVPFTHSHYMILFLEHIFTIRLYGPNMIILKWILEKRDGRLDWIDLALDRDTWQAFVNAVMNLRVP